MNSTNSIEIGLSKKKLILLALLFILFFIVSLWILIHQPKSNHPIFGNRFLMNIASFLGVVLALLILYFSIKKMFDKKPGLIINDIGVDDNSGANSIGLILWKDIEYVVNYKDINSAYNKFICLIVNNPQDYIAKQKNSIRKRLMRENLKHAATPILISSNNLKISFKELEKLLTDKFQEYKIK